MRTKHVPTSRILTTLPSQRAVHIFQVSLSEGNGNATSEDAAKVLCQRKVDTALGDDHEGKAQVWKVKVPAGGRQWKVFSNCEDASIVANVQQGLARLGDTNLFTEAETRQQLRVDESVRNQAQRRRASLTDIASAQNLIGQLSPMLSTEAEATDANAKKQRRVFATAAMSAYARAQQMAASTMKEFRDV